MANGRRLFGGIGIAALLMLLLGACGNAAPLAEEVQSKLETAYRDMAEWTGRQVDSLEGVNERVAASTREFVALFGELDYKLAFRENGIAFESADGVGGVIGIQGNVLVLNLAFPGDDANTAHTVARIMTVFSENNWAEDRLTAITNGNEPQTVQLENGWIETDGEIVNVRLERPIL